jgi:hypothetical protein
MAGVLHHSYYCSGMCRLFFRLGYSMVYGLLIDCVGCVCMCMCIVGLISPMRLKPTLPVIVLMVVITISLAITMVTSPYYYSSLSLHTHTHHQFNLNLHPSIEWYLYASCHVMCGVMKGININPLEVIFYKANRDIETQALTKYSEWILQDVRSRPKT